MKTFYSNFDEMVNYAQHAIDSLSEKESSKQNWLQALLDILKKSEYARVTSNDGQFVDVSKIANTYSYASFFDIYNSIRYFDINIMPIQIDELKYSLTNFLFERTIISKETFL